MDYNFIFITTYLLCILLFICGLGCMNYLWIVTTGRSLINHPVSYYFFGILGLVMVILSIIGIMNIKLIL
jgi:hypothetical protein